MSAASAEADATKDARAEGERAGREAVLRELTSALRSRRDPTNKLEAAIAELHQMNTRDANDLALELHELSEEVRR